MIHHAAASREIVEYVQLKTPGNAITRASLMRYDVLKDFQSGIVGVVGFAIAIFTLWWNANQAEIGRIEEAKRTSHTVQMALCQELLSIQEELGNIDSAARKVPPASFYFTLERPYIYETLVKDIGVLAPEQAKEIIRTHRDLHLLMGLIRNQAVNPAAPIAELQPQEFPKTVELTPDSLEAAHLGIRSLTSDPAGAVCK
jgi:hypothetical protein